MSDVEIVHPVPVEECEPWAASLSTTFFGDPTSDAFRLRVQAHRRDWQADRRWGARADGRWVGTLGTLPSRLTVPGGEVAADGLTMVTVAATHRRRGLLSAMLTDSLRTARDRGDAVSILIAAEWPIYGRFGYAPAETMARYVLQPRRGALPPGDRGRVRQVTAAELAEVGPAVYDAVRRERPGCINRPQSWWDRALGGHGIEPARDPGERTPTYVVHEGPDGVDGFTWWTPKRDFDLDGTLGVLTVGELQAATEDAYRGMWAYLSGIDGIGEIELDTRPVDEPVRWLLADGRALRQTYAGDGMWLRLLDVPAALSARRYATADRLVLDVVDDQVDGFAAGRYLLDGGRDGASCTPAPDAEPDVRVDQRTLAAAYLGGFTVRQRAVTGQVTELTPGAVHRLDAMLATDLPPWCATPF